MSYRVLVADDHPLMRTALRQTIAQALGDSEVIEAARFEQISPLLETVETTDLIILDLHMPGMNGFIGLMMLRSAHPAIPVLVVSASEDHATIQRAIDCGASGFVPKSAPNTEIGEAIRAVLDGEIWMPTVEEVVEPGDGDPNQRISSLTPKELRVLAGIAEGKLNKQIAYEMSIAEKTVKAHVTTILRKLGVLSRTQAAVIASQLALIAPPPPVE
ncbi:MAG TPA: response regulator transcription factor [Azospirillum sp.]|nr:response regulator transcription factor [Azospirillum sp.]